MSADDLKTRTFRFAVAIVRFVDLYLRQHGSDVIGRQLLRAGTSVGANLRAAGRARSRRDFIAKMKIVEEECDEAIYWLELLVAAGKIPSDQATPFLREANSLLAMTVASIRTAKANEAKLQMTKNP